MNGHIYLIRNLVNGKGYVVPFTDEHRANIKLGWAKRKEREAKNAVR